MAMSRTITVNNLPVAIEEAGSGAPILYLHGFADIHSSSSTLLPFHHNLAQAGHVIAPAHPGCGESGEDEAMDNIEDLVFHYLRILDALKLDKFSIVGSAMGGWIGAELAVRIPERVQKLALIGATGLFVPGQPIGDLFMMVLPQGATNYTSYREMLFRSADAPEALDMFPNARMSNDREALRYRLFRFASRVGFKPPYFHHRQLIDRLDRYKGPALVLAGKQDRLVPLAHAEAYKAGLSGATMRVIDGAGNAVIVEKPDETAKLVTDFLKG
jgi:pimeloyl-ACP methyl ester carboxylesterase